MPSSTRVERPARAALVPARPALLPGLARLRRDATTVQLGIEAPHAVVLHGLSPGHHAVLRSLDGSHDRLDLELLAGRAGLAAGAVAELLELLASRGLLIDSEALLAAPAVDDDERARLTPDLVSLALRHAADGDARAALDRRRAAWIDVRGAGRVGSAVATLLGAAGVGRVSVADPLPVVPADHGPAGLAPLSAGGSRELATRERVRSVATSVRVGREPAPASPDLVVLAPDTGPDAALVATWSRRSTPHLVTFVRETTGVVGPLVVPGKTGCLACLELHRRDRDPGWPVVAAQLGRGPAGAACDVSLATLVAAQAALQALAYVDGTEVAVHDGTLETSVRSGVTRRRSWSPHPTCGCRWAVSLSGQAADPPR